MPRLEEQKRMLSHEEMPRGSRIKKGYYPIRRCSTLALMALYRERERERETELSLIVSSNEDVSL